MTLLETTGLDHPTPLIGAPAVSSLTECRAPMDFDVIHNRVSERAERRHGTSIAERLCRMDAVEEERRRSHQGRDDRYLAAMARAIFQAGFQWRIIDQKWPDFERAFSGFELARNALMSPEDFDRLLSDKSIVRHGAKIAAVCDNAVFLSDLGKEHGNAAKVLEAWPKHDLIGLIRLMRKRGARLGGATGFNALRIAGIDTFMPWTDVAAGLTDLGVIDGKLTSLGELTAAAEFFADWSDAVDQPIARLSQLLALSIGPVTTLNENN